MILRKRLLSLSKSSIEPISKYMKVAPPEKVKDLEDLDKKVGNNFDYEIKKVPASRIVATQPNVDPDTIKKYSNYYNAHGHHPRHHIPTAIHHKGTYYIWDGHHRAIAEARRKGHVTVLARTPNSKKQTA